MAAPRHTAEIDMSRGDTASSSPPVIRAMTGIRAVAAAWVVLLHLREVLLALLPGTSVVDPWLRTGFFGVDVFFILSGFIISHNYAERLRVLSRASYREFLAARFARLYPVHLLTTLLAALLVGYFAYKGAVLNPNQDRTTLGFVGNLFLLQALPGVDAWNGASWSISCEAAAYLAFPLVAAALMRTGRLTALTLAAVVVAAQILVTAWLMTGVTTSSIPVYWVRIAGEFTLGCLLWAFWRHGVRRHWRWDVMAVASVVVSMVIIGTTEGAATWLVLPFLALAVLATASMNGPVSRLLGSRPAEWGGRISYSLYLVHVPAFTVSFMLVHYWELTDAPLGLRVVLVVAYLAVAVGSAAVLYHVVEEPARRALRRRLRPGSHVEHPLDPGADAPHVAGSAPTIGTTGGRR